MSRVICYARVSTEEQANKGVSLDSQIAKLKAYSELYDLEVVEVIVDAGESAKNLKRPGIQRALDMLRTGKADGLVVLKLDRLTRNVGDLSNLIETYFSDKAGKHLFSVCDSIDTRSAAGRLVINILASISQWEREVIGERTKEALSYKKSQGLRTGNVPFGYKLDDTSTEVSKKTGAPAKLIEDPIEQEALAIVRELRSQGMSIRAMVEELNKRNVPTAKGGRWHIKTVQRALAA